MNGKLLSIMCSLALLPLAGCGSNADSSSSQFNADDVMFAQMMIPHHEQAIEMSDIALDPMIGASDAVRELATEIKNAQDPEIELMRQFLTEWGAPMTPMDDMDHGSMMTGMLSPEELSALGSKTGREFDIAWIEAMIAHHEGAIAMADEVLKLGSNADTRRLAESIISAQRAEIEVLRSLL